MTELSELRRQALSPLFFSFAALNTQNSLKYSFAKFEAKSTYGFSLLVGSSKFVALIFETAEFNFQFVEAASELSDLVASIVQVIWKYLRLLLNL